MRLTGLAALGLLLITAPALTAGSCGYERCFGAIAVGDNGQIGHTSGHRAAPSATDAARQNCGSSCENVELFWNACGAVATGAQGIWAFGWDIKLEIANDKALALCNSESTTACYVRDWICSK